MCAAVWSSTTLAARHPGFSFPQPTPTHLTALAAPAARAKTTSGTQGNLGSISAISRVQSSMPPEKSSLERMRGGLILKTEAANRAYNRQKGQLRVIFSLNGRKLLSSLQARWVLLWGQNPSPALDKSVLTVVIFWRYWYQFTGLPFLRHLVCQSVQHMAICSQYKVNLSALQCYANVFLLRHQNSLSSCKSTSREK